MSLHVNVEGGTSAGVKAPLAEPAPAWHCHCREPEWPPGPQKVNLVAPAPSGPQKLRPGSWRNCPYCGARRPPR